MTLITVLTHMLFFFLNIRIDGCFLNLLLPLFKMLLQSTMFMHIIGVHVNN